MQKKNQNTAPEIYIHNHERKLYLLKTFLSYNTFHSSLLSLLDEEFRLTFLYLDIKNVQMSNYKRLSGRLAYNNIHSVFYHLK